MLGEPSCPSQARISLPDALRPPDNLVSPVALPPPPHTNNAPDAAGALAGNPFGVDRQFIAKELGFFGGVCPNSMDAVSDRDYVAETVFALALCLTHLSRWGGGPGCGCAGAVGLCWACWACALAYPVSVYVTDVLLLWWWWWCVGTGCVCDVCSTCCCCMPAASSVRDCSTLGRCTAQSRALCAVLHHVLCAGGQRA